MLMLENLVLHLIQNTQRKQQKYRSTFMRDDMLPWILEKRIESVPWCSEIQKQDLRKPLINIPIPHGTQDVWSLNQFTHMCSRENKKLAYTHIHTISII